MKYTPEELKAQAEDKAEYGDELDDISETQTTEESSTQEAEGDDGDVESTEPTATEEENSDIDTEAERANELDKRLHIKEAEWKRQQAELQRNLDLQAAELEQERSARRKAEQELKNHRPPPLEELPPKPTYRRTPKPRTVSLFRRK